MSSEGTPAHKPTSLRPGQAWYLAVMAIVVVALFAFVVLPYVDSGKKAVSGEPVPAFDLEVISGQDLGDRLSLADLAGTPVLVDFWASWCEPCRVQSRALSEVAQRMGDDLVVVGVATSDDRAAALEFVREHQPSYVNLFDEGGRLGNAIGVRNLPTLMVLDEKGTIQRLESRVFSADELAAIAEQVSL